MMCSNGIYFTKDAPNSLFIDFVSVFFIKGMYVVALARAIIIISGFTFHLLLVIFFL